MFLCAGVGLHAQRTRFVDTNWQSMSADSVRPWSGFGIQLEGNWQDSAYEATIEYPQLHRINTDELKRWNLSPDDIPEWPHVNTSVGMSNGSATLDAEFLPIIRRDGGYYAILSYKSVISSKPLGKVETPQSVPAERYSRNSVLADGKWVKIKVTETGIHKITSGTLRSMGFKDPSKVRLFGYGGAVLPETNLQDLTDDLPEQALWRGNGYVLFYAQGPVSWKRTAQGYEHTVNTYSDYGCYFLTDIQDSVICSFTQMESDTAIGTIIDTYPDFDVYDPDEFSWYRSGRRMFESYDYASGNSRSYRFNLQGLASDSVEVKVAFSAASAKSSKVSVSVNGTETGSFGIAAKGSDNVAVAAEKSFISRGQFKEQNTVRLVHERASGESGHLDYIRLNFRRRLAMQGSSTVFRVDQTVNDASFSISGSNADVQVWKISADGSSAIVPSVYQDGVTVTMAASYTPDDILAAVNVKGGFPEPLKVGDVQNQNLHALDSIDMVIVVPASGKLTAAAQRLAAAHRVVDSLSVAVVRADMVYNEFSSGTPDATALRRFMKMLYDRPGVTPRYLLLMGNGAWDNRMHVSDWAGQNPDDYLLCYESYESLSHTASYVMEDYFGLLDDTEGRTLINEKVDLGVGRLPVSTASQAREKVDRIIEYMTGAYAGAWCNRILVLGDDGDNNIHMNDADKIAGIYQKTNPAVDVRKIYWDAYQMEVTASYNGYPAIRKLLLEQLDEGALIVNYSGHGSMEVLSHELVMNKADMSSLKSKRLPFWITASCDIAPFDSPLESMGMNLIGNTQGGAIGMLATTRTVYASLNGAINRSFSRYVLSGSKDGRQNTLGDALRLAKNELVTTGEGENDRTENKLHFVLLGDPALRLAVARLEAVVDSFNGLDVSVTDTAKAGAVITVTGHIECNGERVPDYRGLLSSTVFDNERLITCRNNLKTAEYPFAFMYRDRILYSGTDSVRNGEFTFSFPVPMDINYSNENGQIILFAQGNDGRNANGSFTGFAVGGTADGLSADLTGPDIRLYLNTPTFQYGANVNATPMLVAELRDSSGLNISGNGLGHDILLIIDNNPNWTWVLNSEFEQTAGDYTCGRVMFSIPELPEGRHELMLRAWDVMNNSSTVYLGFKVVSDLKPRFTIDVTDSPAREGTTFVITHDRPGQNAIVTVQVSSSDGTLQWMTTRRDESGLGVTVIDWNLHGNSGHRMQPGLYIVRASVGTDGGGSSQASCKLVIVGP